MPANREQQAALNLPEPRIWTPEDLASFLRVKPSWVLKRSKEIPRCAGKLIRFDTEDADFQDWLRGWLKPVDRSNNGA
jgi:hypothetical protein